MGNCVPPCPKVGCDANGTAWGGGAPLWVGGGAVVHQGLQSLRVCGWIPYMGGCSPWGDEVLEGLQSMGSCPGSIQRWCECCCGAGGGHSFAPPPHIPLPPVPAGKECDLNRQCGVLNPDTKKVCTRLLTCKVTPCIRPAGPWEQHGDGVLPLC